MAKSKYAPALFEVIKNRQAATDGQKLSVPKWWKRASREGEPTQGDLPPPEAVDPLNISPSAVELDPPALLAPVGPSAVSSLVSGIAVTAAQPAAGEAVAAAPTPGQQVQSLDEQAGETDSIVQI